MTGFSAVEKNTVTISGQASSSGDNTIVAAPGAGVRIVISTLLMQGASSTATTMKTTNGASGTEIIRCLAQNQGDGVLINFAPDTRPKLSGNTALILNLSGANVCYYSYTYYTETA